MASKLLIRYLWIDSLCVLQYGPGSAEDWEEHARSMQLVYLNAVLNISIDRASNPHEGAYTTREVNHIQTCNVLWNREENDEDIWTVSDYTSDGKWGLVRSPLQSRAWPLHERLLSPRILHFTSEQIMWERKEAELLSESLPDGHHLQDPHADFPFLIPVPSQQALTGEEERVQMSNLTMSFSCFPSSLASSIGASKPWAYTLLVDFTGKAAHMIPPGKDHL